MENKILPIFDTPELREIHTSAYMLSMLHTCKNFSEKWILKNCMDIYAWNRKDALPEETTNKFNEILKKLGIETFVVSEEQYNNLWFSNRIEIKGLNNIGTNGKGVTPQYTMASALGEFMERLQSGMLIDYLYPFFNPKTDMAGDINLLADSSKKFFGDILSNYKEAELNAIINDSMVNSRSLNFIDISTNENFLIPERLINVLCGTNGIAAGNTFEEAFVQGISEIFERYVLQYIYKEQYSDLFKVFNESVYENLNSYNLIRAIKERKYHVYWVCSQKTMAGRSCDGKNISEEALKKAFVLMYNKLRRFEKVILDKTLSQLLNLREKVSGQNNEISQIDAEIASLCNKNNTYTELHTKGIIDDVSYLERTSELKYKITELRGKRVKLLNADEDERLIEDLKVLKETLDEYPKVILRFDNSLFSAIVDKVVVGSEKTVMFKLKGGLHLEVKMAEVI